MEHKSTAITINNIGIEYGVKFQFYEALKNCR